jgi:ribonuclease R
MSTRKRTPIVEDPYAGREAAKYEHPVPSRELILGLLKEAGKLLTFDEICDGLQIAGERDREAMSRRLRAMERDGQVHRNRKARYGLTNRLDMISGSVIAHPDGFGFLAPDDNSGDLFLSPREMRKAMHGDRVMGQETGLDARGRREGIIIEVLERRHRIVVGRYENDGIARVVPADKRLTQEIFIPADMPTTARPGQIVEAEITQYPSAKSRGMGKIVTVLGDHMAPGMEIDVAIRKFELPHSWAPEVLVEAGQFGETVPATVSGTRKDLRSIPLVTIDGEDARDFDDAVYCARDGKGWRLIVAIADVSYYVRPDTALDQEAYQRGTSVYFPDRVIPMLPEALSNKLCSLMPDVDRLCMVCDMRISAQGKIGSYEFYAAVMRSHARLTYNKVAAILVDGDETLRRQYAKLVPDLENLYALYKVLHRVRLDRGAVDFELPETKIVFDPNRKIERIVAVQRNDAHRLIEECMLAANVCAAEFLQKNKVPTPYRVHAGPTPEKLSNLREFLFEFGLSLGGGDEPTADDYAEVLARVAGRPEARLLQTVMLRSLSQAIYSPDNIGHFALAYASYAHFTSPIRRYPDLMVHRSIKDQLEKRSGKGKVTHSIKRILGRKPDEALMEKVKRQSEHCSMTGRRADEAVWDVIKWLKSEYMMDRVGDHFPGIISGVTNFGLFIELDEIFVEGLIHVTSLGNDYYHYEPKRHCLIGERTRRMYRLGDGVTVRVVRVDLDDAKIDLELVDHGGGTERAARKQPRSAGARRSGKKSGKRTATESKPPRPEQQGEQRPRGKRKSRSRRK